MDDFDHKRTENEEPLNEEREGFAPPQASSQEGDIPAEKEASFLNMRTLIIATLGLVGMIVFVLLLAGGMFGVFSLLEPEGAAPPPAQEVSPIVPAGPPLQVSPGQDVQQAQAEQQQRLEGYSWIDQQNGVVQIPIEKAMELIAQRGLPVTSSTQPAAADEPDNSGFGFVTPQP